jgi:hypothetical protein
MCFFNSPPTSYFLCSSFSSKLLFRYINSQSFYQRERQSFTSIQKWKELLVYKLLIFLIVQAARNSDTSVRLNMYQTTLPIFPVGSHIHTCCCENLKSHFEVRFWSDHEKLVAWTGSLLKFRVWDVAPRSHVEVVLCFRGSYCIHLQGDEAVRISEMSVHFKGTTRIYIPEDYKLHTWNFTARLQWDGIRHLLHFQHGRASVHSG